MIVQLLLIAVVAGAVYGIVVAVRRSRAIRTGPSPEGAAGAASAIPENPPAGDVAQVAQVAAAGSGGSDVVPVRWWLDDYLDRWVGAGLLGVEQSAAILAYERAAAAAMAPTVPAAPTHPPAPPRRIPAVAEALGYLGGMLAILGLGLLVGQYWPDWPLTPRLVLSGVVAVIFLMAGAVAKEDEDPAFARFRWFTWLASSAATGLFVGVVFVDGFGVDRPQPVVAACAAAVAAHSGALWAWRNRPVQQVVALVAVVVFAGGLVSVFASSGFSGLAVWVAGVVLALLGQRRATPLPLATAIVGLVAVVVGPSIVSVEWEAFGLVLGLTTAAVLLALAIVEGHLSETVDIVLASASGGALLFQVAPAAIGYFAERGGVATGLVVWVVGVVLIVLASSWERIRVPQVLKASGGLVVVIGAAVTGAQSPAFATLFGLVTAVTLVGVGMLPGNVLLSLFGSVGLLINVPWSITWFFPGASRAPLLILVTGLLILAVAVLLTRMRGRFRSELGRGGPQSVRSGVSS